MNEDETIVRALAKRGPFVEEHRGAYLCSDCSVNVHDDSGEIDDPTIHESSCLWRRACDRYPQEVNAS